MTTLAPSLMDTSANLIGVPPLPKRIPTGQDDAIWVVIPAFNEAKVLPQTLADVFGYFKNVVVVDDNSADETSAVAHAGGAHVCKHPINLGQALLYRQESISLSEAGRKESSRSMQTASIRQATPRAWLPS
jgi:hypothetical protein